MARKFMAILAFILVLGGAIAGGKSSDVEKLTRIGQVVAHRVGERMPEAAAVAGPLAAVRSGEVLPVAERVRIRLRTEKMLEGAKIVVVDDGKKIVLQGLAQNKEQIARALELTQNTQGVNAVDHQIALEAK
jgi:hypothetical protein